jgi:hypothetical protein
MMRIATPETVWPRHFFNRLNKMQTRASKINGLPINEAKNDEIPEWIKVSFLGFICMFFFTLLNKWLVASNFKNKKSRQKKK